MEQHKLLYHYTTAAGLIGIIESNSLWATSAYYLNDSRELLEGVQIGRGLLEKQLKLASRIQTERINWLLHDIRRFGTVETNHIYVCSLSDEGDQLSQWRAYCRGGGFSIGFPAEQLKESVEVKKDFVFQQCEYDPKTQEESVKSVIDQEAAAWINSDEIPVMNDPNRFSVSLKFACALSRVASRIKHSSFREECESRFITHVTAHYKAEEVLFRAKNGQIVPYKAIHLPPQTDSSFWGKIQVNVGPTSHPYEAKAAVYDLVRKHCGHAIGIGITESPFQDW